MTFYQEVVELGETMDKLESLLNDNNMVYSFKRDVYPVSLIVSPNRGVSEQMELFSNDGGNTSASDARLEFIFQDADIIVRTDSRLVIPDGLMSKIKGYAKKLHYLYLQAFYRQEMERRKYCEAEEPEQEDEGQE